MKPLPKQVEPKGEVVSVRGRLAVARWFVLVVAIGGLGGSGCATHSRSVPSNRVGAPNHTGQSVPHVEIFRGLGGYMPGIANLQQRLAERGIASTASNSSQAEVVASRILQRRARGDDAPIVLIGYAVGGGGARRTAQKLSDHRVAVDAIILIDPSLFEPVPGNVRTCFVAHKPELLQMWNSIMRGNPVKTESKQTTVIHVNLGEHDQAARLKGTTHLAITADAWIQQMLVRQVVEALEVD